MAVSKIPKGLIVKQLWAYATPVQSGAIIVNASDYDAIIVNIGHDNGSITSGLGIWGTYYLVKTQNAWYSDGTRYGKIEYKSNGDVVFTGNNDSYYNPLNVYGVKY